MSDVADIEKSETAFPLTLVVDQEGVGGAAGLSPTVALRDPSVAGSYLDWGDNTFKTSGWLSKDGALTDLGGGTYQRVLNVAALPLPAGSKFVAEYKLAQPGFYGADADVYFITTVSSDTSIVRKYHTNRIHEASGTPGTLHVYDDDDATLFRTHELRDESGGPIAPSVQVPARRSKGT